MSQIGKRAEQKEEENQRDCTEPEEGEKEYYRKLRVMHYRVMQMVFNATRSSWRLARVCVCVRVRWQVKVEQRMTMVRRVSLYLL